MENPERTTRSFDKTADKEMTKYTKEVLFPFLNENCIYAEENRRKDSQLKGVDYILLSEAGKEVYVDEKSQLHYLNNNRDTYSLEIGMLNKAGEHIKGRFIDEDNVTELYLFVFPNAEGKTYQDVKKEDFDKVEYLLVPKQAIKDYLAEKGLTIEQVLEVEDELRTRGYYEDKPRQSKTVNGIRMTLSLEGRNGEPMSEQPFNIILKKEVYEELAILKLETNHGVIEKEVNKLEDYENLSETGRYDELTVEEIAYKLSYREIACLDLITKYSTPGDELIRNFESAVLKNGRLIINIEQPSEKILRLALGSYVRMNFEKEPLGKLLTAAEERIDKLVENGLKDEKPMIKENIGRLLKAKLEEEVAKYSEPVETGVEKTTDNEDNSDKNDTIDDDGDDVE